MYYTCTVKLASTTCKYYFCPHVRGETTKIAQSKRRRHIRIKMTRYRYKNSIKKSRHKRSARTYIIFHTSNINVNNISINNIDYAINVTTTINIITNLINILQLNQHPIVNRYNRLLPNTISLHRNHYQRTRTNHKVNRQNQQNRSLLSIMSLFSQITTRTKHNRRRLPHNLIPIKPTRNNTKHVPHNRRLRSRPNTILNRQRNTRNNTIRISTRGLPRTIIKSHTMNIITASPYTRHRNRVLNLNTSSHTLHRSLNTNNNRLTPLPSNLLHHRVSRSSVIATIRNNHQHINNPMNTLTNTKLIFQLHTPVSPKHTTNTRNTTRNNSTRYHSSATAPQECIPLAT